ncbi:LuxR C-terminal-related transcriptional regulator [Paenibacillaceae bacterium WGS1546]|uniref:LuxR C-terminal-related transcriptional regulator n=1 Tax=Cohnella sp. WGS1546 TaxID=3366810 RepID=UPI00372D0530
MAERTGTGHILHSKLYMPPVPRPFVSRPRLLAQLNEGLDRRASFVSAPAGYGKTTLVSDWARQIGAPVAWLSLDAKDNDLVRFWSYTVEAVRRALGIESSGEASTARLSPGQYEPFLVALLNEWSGLSGKFVLILDDWHVVEDRDVIDSISYVMEYLPPSAHLVLASRTFSGFAKARWISRGWIHEVNARQLKFDLREAEQYFRDFDGRSFGKNEIERIWLRTEGWATGLRLMSLSMREREREPSRSPERWAEEGERVEHFLLEEVFEALDEPTKRFLLNVALLQRFNGSLCEAAAGEGGAKKLAELASLQLFLIPLDGRKEWYRFHHLFGEFLRKRRLMGDPDQARETYRAAALWCESRNLLEEAVEYYLAGQAFADAVRLLEQMKSLMIRREFSTLKAWLAAVPETLLRQHPFLYFTYVFSLLWAGEPTLAERHLLQAERHFESASESWNPEDKDRFLGYLYYVRNFKATQYDMDMVKGLDYIRLSLKHSPGGTDLIFAAPHMPLSPSVYRSYNGKRGKHLPIGLADDFFRNMIEFMTPMGLQNLILVCYGELLYERNELEEAERCIRQGLQGGLRFQPEKVYVPASLFLSRASKARQDWAQAELWLAEALRKAREDGAEDALILIEAEMAALGLDRGDREAAEAWMARYKVSPDDPVSVYRLFVYIVLVRTLMETERGQEAWTLSERLLPIAVKGHRPMDALDLQALQAVMLRKAGKPEQALLKLEEALKYAHPDAYIRVFADKGKAVAELLSDYVQQRLKGNLRDRSAPPLAYARRVLAACGGGSADASRSTAGALGTLLTPREYAIFRYMEEGMDNAAIAGALGIGMGTLKTHINHIYGKLQATNRVEAIKRGKEIQG